MNKLLIIGADSFIAGNFIKLYKDLFSFVKICRVPINDPDSIVLTDFFSIENQLFNDIDVVINFAAIVHNPKIKDEASYRRVNYELPVYLAQKAYESGAKMFVQMSSMAVYGDLNYININSNCTPSTLYGKYKLKTDEELIAKYSGSNMLITCLRPSMVYGAGKAPGNLGKLIKLAKLNIPLPFKTIANKRQFCNIFLLLPLLKYCIENRKAGVFLVADTESVSTFEIISLINQFRSKKNLQFESRILWKTISILLPGIVKKLTSDLVIESNFDNSILGLDANITFSTGLREML